VQKNDPVGADTPILDIETDKVVLEITTPCEGCVSNYTVALGDALVSGQVLAVFTPSDSTEAKPGDDPSKLFPRPGATLSPEKSKGPKTMSLFR